MLKHCLGFTRVEWKFSEFPAPFDSLFRTSVKKHAAQDLSFDMAYEFFLSDLMLYTLMPWRWCSTRVGKTKRRTVIDFLPGFMPLSKQARVPPNQVDVVVTQEVCP